MYSLKYEFLGFRVYTEVSDLGIKTFRVGVELPSSSASGRMGFEILEFIASCF